MKVRNLKLLLAVWTVLGWAAGLSAQSYEPYSPQDPEWRQGRHDYKKTAKAPWRCGTPATVAKTYSREDPNNADLYVTTARNDSDDTTDIFYTGNDRGVGAGGPNTWLEGANIGSAICDNEIWPDYGTGECVLTTNRVGFCPAWEEWPWTEGTFLVKIDFSCNESWREQFSSDDKSNLTIIDIDRDGTAEIYWSQDNDLYMFRENIASWSPSWRVGLPSDGGDPVIGDFDGNGNWDVCVPLDNGTVRCYNAADGSYLWSGTPPCGFFNTPSGNEDCCPSEWKTSLMAWDLDSDGADELVIVGNGCVSAYDVPTWNQLWRVNVGASKAGAMGDLDGDGLYDVVVNRNGTVTVIDGQSGSIIATFTESTEGCSAPTVADVDGDGIWDVVLACTQPVAWSMANGWTTRIWEGADNAPYTITGDLVVSRLTDNSLQLVFGDLSCYVSQWVCDVAAFVEGGEEGESELSAEERPSRVESPAIEVLEDGVRVKGYSGEVVVYTPDGSLVKRVRVEGEAYIRLDKGVYILKIGTAAQKVVVR